MGTGGLFSAFIDLRTFGVLRHEFGHYAAVRLLLDNVNPSIVINSDGSGGTIWKGMHLSSLGEALGKTNCKILIAVAGPLLAIASSSLLIISAACIAKKNPELSCHLVAMAVMGIAHHVFYALTALLQEKLSPGHDFFPIWQLGNIHPIVAAVAMVAIPLLTTLVVVGVDYYIRCI